ncbi:MAG TPA: methyltransferase domain-containing protein [Pyrinomonadaceae bacterium]|nr:methyltransferase domain-containing protein [Pyrinomonadaceae bacterium]
MERKSPKELAFLHDLYIATDWGERFAELVDEHIELPEEGRALYVEAGTGGHALALQERAGTKLELTCVDQNDECLEVACAKAMAVHESIRFQCETAQSLSFGEDQFDLVLGNASFVLSQDVKPMLAEMVRVTKPGAIVAWWLPTFSSFGEFFSIYWEALQSAGLEDHGVEVEHMITALPAISDAEQWAADAGLINITSWTAIEEFDYDSGEQFLNSPLITDFLLPNWLEPVPAAARERATQELARIIDEERHSGEFGLTLKATLIVGKKSQVQ